MCDCVNKNGYDQREVLESYIQKIEPINQKVCEEARAHWDSIAKPLRSLGKLETMIIQLAGIQGKKVPNIKEKAVLIFCGDNGVVEEGVTQTTSEVTAIVTENFTKGIASINSFAKVMNATVIPVDIGVCRDINVAGVWQKKVAYGTKNMAKEPAMTRETCIQAIVTGIECIKELKEKGYTMVMTGEMGIGNTTTSSAVLSVLENLPVEEVTGKGAGLSSEGLERKIKAIKTAIQLHQPDKGDPIDVLSKVGGLDICGMVGAFLGGAIYNIPMIIDGFISAVAANCAIRLAPLSTEYMFASHCSAEPAGKRALEVIDKSPSLQCDMCLGEGTGAVLGAQLIEFGLAAYCEIAAFEDVDFERYTLLS